MSEGPQSGWSLRAPEAIGILLIAIGVLYLLGNANIIEFTWDALWPFLLLGIGALLLVGARRPAAQPPAGGTTRPLADGPEPASADPAPAGVAPARGGSSVQVPRDGSTQLELSLGVGAGTFRIGGGATELVEARSIREDIFTRADRTGSRAHIRLRQDANWLPWSFRGGTEWEVRLAEDVPMVFSLNAGAGDFTIDLSPLTIVDATVSIGAAHARLVLPRPTGDVGVRITAGASTVSIRIPDGVEARVRSEGALLRYEGRGETPNYATSRDRVTVTVSGGASSVTVL